MEGRAGSTLPDRHDCGTRGGGWCRPRPGSMAGSIALGVRASADRLDVIPSGNSMSFPTGSTTTKPRSFHAENFILSISLVFVAFLGALHVLTRSFSSGPNLDRELDSLIYISVADSLVTGDGIITFSGHSSALWPPFYSISIALVGFLGVDSVYAGLLVNAVAFGFVIFGTGIWLRKYTGSQALAIGGAVTVMTSYTLTWLSSNVLSESLFICLTLLALAQLGRFTGSEDYRQSAIVWSAIFAALAAVTRYMGITIILTAAILILMHSRLSLSRRLKYAAAYCGISIAPLTLWMIRNWLVIGHPIGNRSASSSRTITSADILRQIGDVFDLWLFSGNSPGWLGVLLVAVAGLIVVGMIRVGLVRQLKNLGPTLPFALFIVVYLLVLAIVFPFASWANVHDRYISPIYVPVIGVSIVLLYHVYKSIVWGKWVAARWMFILIVGIGWSEGVLRATRLNYDETSRRIENRISTVDGYTYNSEVIDYLINHPIDGRIYSNEAIALFGMAVLYDVNELKRVYFIPEDTDPRGCLSWLQQIGESDEQPYLVYFFEEIASESCNPVELQSQSNNLEFVTRTSDGVVYEVTARS